MFVFFLLTFTLYLTNFLKTLVDTHKYPSILICNISLSFKDFYVQYVVLNMDFSEIHCIMHFQHLGDFLLLLSISSLIIVSSKHSEWFPLFDKFFDLIHCQYWQMFHVHVRKTWDVQLDLTNLSFPSSLPTSLHRLWLHTSSASWLLQSWHLLPRGGYALTQPAYSLLPFCAIVAMYLFALFFKLKYDWFIILLAPIF